MTTVVQPPSEDYNGWADFWRNDIGINVIAWNKGEGRSNKVSWTEWQDKPIPQELHDRWKSTNAFKDGIARIPGICWHKKPFNPRLRWWDVDIDKQSAIDAICTRNGKNTTIEELSKIFIVEMHEDNPTRLHICGYYDSDESYPKVNPGNICELKCNGSHGIIRCTNSLHYFEENDKLIEKGHRYGIIGTIEPTTNNAFVEHVLGICNVSTQTDEYNGNKPSLASTLWKDDATVNEGENRHAAMLSLMDSLLIKFPDENLEVIFQMAMAKNRLLCKDRDGKDIAPIPESELRTMFEQCKEFARKKLEERVQPTQAQTYELPLGEDIEQLGLPLTKMCLIGNKLFLYNGREKPFEVPYYAKDLQKTVDAAVQALINSHEFDDKRKDIGEKFGPLLSNRLFEFKNKLLSEASAQEESTSPQDNNPLTVALDLVEEKKVDLFLDEVKNPYALVKVNGHLETFSIRHQNFHE